MTSGEPDTHRHHDEEHADHIHGVNCGHELVNRQVFWFWLRSVNPIATTIGDRSCRGEGRAVLGGGGT